MEATASGTLSCAQCDASFTQTGRGPKRRHCYKCQPVGHGHVVPNTRDRTCARCSTEFTPTYGPGTGKGAKGGLCQDCTPHSWDCHTCGFDTRQDPDNAKAQRAAAVGQVTFHWGANGKPECTRCRKRRARLKKIETRKRQERKRLARSASTTSEFYYHEICLQCGKPEPFVAMGPYVGCSDKCTALIGRRAAIHNRLEGIRAAEAFDLVHAGRVYHRDGGICQICRVAVPPPGAVPATSHNAANLDHIVGIMHGGDNTLDNMQLTHQICNVKRTEDASYRTSRARRRAEWYATGANEKRT